MKFVLIDPGSFPMGGSVDIPLKSFRVGPNVPVHDVTLSKSYYLQTTEVTLAQWRAVGVAGGSKSDEPVQTISWEWAQEFVKRLNQKEHDFRYRLPTEAEWEYACRAGGQEPDLAPNVDDVAWWWGNAGKKAHLGGQKKPNAWGLYDMRGNVWEWVQDRYGPYSAEAQVDPQGPSSGGERLFRGGSIGARDPTDMACSCRRHTKQTDEFTPRFAVIGLRCARTP
jgi:formylglycine-generating enzyme required for sulfatase activity